MHVTVYPSSNTTVSQPQPASLGRPHRRVNAAGVNGRLEASASPEEQSRGTHRVMVVEPTSERAVVEG